MTPSSMPIWPLRWGIKTLANGRSMWFLDSRPARHIGAQLGFAAVWVSPCSSRAGSRTGQWFAFGILTILRYGSLNCTRRQDGVQSLDPDLTLEGPRPTVLTLARGELRKLASFEVIKMKVYELKSLWSIMVYSTMLKAGNVGYIYFFKC